MSGGIHEPEVRAKAMDAARAAIAPHLAGVSPVDGIGVLGGLIGTLVKLYGVTPQAAAHLMAQASVAIELGRSTP